MSERKPINSVERAQILRLGVAIGMLQESAADKRIAMVPYGKRDIAMIRSKAKKLYRDICDTIPLNQLQQIHANIKHATCHVGVVKMPEHQRRQKYGQFLSNAACEALFIAVEDHCRMCMLNKHEQKKCPVRAALDEMWIQGADGTGSESECPYWKM